MATTSHRLQSIKRELQAQKLYYRRSANSLPLHTQTLTYSTKENSCHWEDTVYGTGFDYEENERVVVTLDTPTGANTLATLELTGDWQQIPIVKRVPYSGGVRWIVATTPSYIWETRTWRPTTYNFTVQTLVKGTLTARMWWEA